MHAIVFAQQFIAVEQTTPAPQGHDILVKIQAIAVNPVDYKVRQSLKGLSKRKILGWDAAGVVEAVGEKVNHFHVGDEVYYAGDIQRDGCYASHALVDEALVGHKPQSLDFLQAAALPLTSITAWEALFDRLKISERDAGKSILIIGGAGGVGSIAIQLAQYAHCKVIATASRPESQQWCYAMGADVVLNHTKLIEQFQQQSLSADYILCLNNTDGYFATMAELIAPQGMICSVVGTTKEHNLDKLKAKSAGFVWEFMFTRSMFNTADKIKQQQLLNQVADLIDKGQIKTTLNRVFPALSVSSIEQAHEQLLTGQTIGKIVLPVNAR
jgi:zinc-binding alcohol dehydrogenase family protein